MAVAITIAIVSLVITSANAKAGIIASDNASNYPTSTTYTDTAPNQPPDNGTGLTWTTFSNTSMTISSGTLTTALGSPYFSLASGGSGTNNGIAVTLDQALNIGDIFSVQIAATSSNNGYIGVSFSQLLLEKVGGTSLWQFSTDNGANDNDTTVTFAAGSQFIYALERTSSTQYEMSLQGNGGNWSQSVTPNDATETLIDFYTVNADAGSFGFNALQVESVPEPSTYAMLIAGGLAMGGAAMRRRQRRLVRG